MNTTGGTNVAASVAGIDAAENKDIKIDDDEEQKYVLTGPTSSPTEGDDVAVTLKADPPHEQASTRLTLNLSLNDGDPGSDYTFTISDIFLDNEIIARARKDLCSQAT